MTKYSKFLTKKQVNNEWREKYFSLNKRFDELTELLEDKDNHLTQQLQIAKKNAVNVDKYYTHQLMIAKKDIIKKDKRIEKVCKFFLFYLYIS